MNAKERLQKVAEPGRKLTAKVLQFIPDIADDPEYTLPTLPKIERERLRMEWNNLDLN